MNLAQAVAIVVYEVLSHAREANAQKNQIAARRRGHGKPSSDNAALLRSSPTPAAIFTVCLRRHPPKKTPSQCFAASSSASGDAESPPRHASQNPLEDKWQKIKEVAYLKVAS